MSCAIRVEGLQKSYAGRAVLKLSLIHILEQELTELKQAVAQGSADAQQEELGDVLFSAANVSRFLDCDAEEALDAATVKFVRRFREMERLAAQQGCAVDDLSAAELDKLWKRAKEVFTKR